MFHPTMLERSRPVTQIARSMKEQSYTSTPRIKGGDEWRVYTVIAQRLCYQDASACSDISTAAFRLLWTEMSTASCDDNLVVLQSRLDLSS